MHIFNINPTYRLFDILNNIMDNKTTMIPHDCPFKNVSPLVNKILNEHEQITSSIKKISDGQSLISTRLDDLDERFERLMFGEHGVSVGVLENQGRMLGILEKLVKSVDDLEKRTSLVEKDRESNIEKRLKKIEEENINQNNDWLTAKTAYATIFKIGSIIVGTGSFLFMVYRLYSAMMTGG